MVTTVIPDSVRRLHTVEQVAERIAFHPESVRRCIRQQRIRALKFGDEWRITDQELDRLFKEGV